MNISILWIQTNATELVFLPNKIYTEHKWLVLVQVSCHYNTIHNTINDIGQVSWECIYINVVYSEELIFVMKQPLPSPSPLLPQFL